MIFRLSEQERLLITNLDDAAFNTRYTAKKGFLIIDEGKDLELIRNAANRKADTLYSNGDKAGGLAYRDLSSRIWCMNCFLLREGGKPTIKLAKWPIKQEDAT